MDKIYQIVGQAEFVIVCNIQIAFQANQHIMGDKEYSYSKLERTKSSNRKIICIVFHPI